MDGSKGGVVETRGRRVLWTQCFLALTLCGLGAWLMSATVLAAAAKSVPFSREVISIIGLVMLVILTAIAVRRPSLLKCNALSRISLFGYLLGFSLYLLGGQQSDASLLFAGVLLCSLAVRWITILVTAALSTLDERGCVTCVVAATVADYVTRVFFDGVSETVLLAFVLACPFLSYAASMPMAREVMERGMEAEPPSEIAITQPSSYLPFSHSLFVALFMFRLAFGFSLELRPASEGVAQLSFGFVTAVILLVLVLVRETLKADTIYRAALLFVVAGFALSLVSGGEAFIAYSTLSGDFLYAGSKYFDALMWIVLARIGARNQLNALPIFTWGRAAAAAGSIVGFSAAWAISQWDEGAAGVAVAIVLVVFVGLNVTILNGFDFQATIDGVRPVMPLRLPSGGASSKTRVKMSCVTADAERPRVFPADDIPRSVIPSSSGDPMVSSADAAMMAPLSLPCERVASEFCLTPRETEILALLARGRNAPYIQEKLVLSRNTVKTHVQNIYAKLGVHSQQELIDLVEAEES